MGLLEDDDEYVDAIKEASHWGSGEYLRTMFVTLMVANQMVRPEHVLAETAHLLSDGILYNQRRLHDMPGLTLTDDQLTNCVLIDFDTKLQRYNKHLSDFPTMPVPSSGLSENHINRLISDELNYDRVALQSEHTTLMSTMTQQRSVYDTIIQHVQLDDGGFFFLNAFGGAGKTFIWRALAAGLRSDGYIVLAVASSGVAALLIPGGRTAHSRFSIPIPIHEDSTCNIPHRSDLAELIIRAKLIIWDEAPMMHRHCFEAVDRTLRDILRNTKPGNHDKPFGGKVVVLGGDFRQVLPVIPKGTRQQIVNSTINSSYLWSHCRVLTLHTNMRLLHGGQQSDYVARKTFADWILSIGDGSIGDMSDDSIVLEILPDLLIQHIEDPIATIVDEIYPNFTQVSDQLGYYSQRAILAPRNELVDLINDYMVSKIVGDQSIYYSVDSANSDTVKNDRPDNVHSPDYLNTISSPGLPNHVLKLKVGVPVMLLRNIDQNAGLCNGTRLIITRLGKFVIEGKVISGSNIGHVVYIPRITMMPSDVRIPFKFQRRQFPITMSFAMTINKSQGQSLDVVGVYLPSPVFSHGQLYVAFSRVTRRGGLHLMLLDDNLGSTNITKNVVYHEVFSNL